MSRTPINQMSYTPGRGSEAAEFTLKELYEELTNLHNSLKKLENRNTDSIEEDVSNLKKEVNDLVLKFDSMFDSILALKTTQHLLETKQSNLENAVIQLLKKIDVDNTAQNLAVVNSQSDEDYENVIKPTIYGS